MFMEEIYDKSMYSEVSINHYDDIKKVFCVDTWNTSDDNEEGKVVATINLKGEVTWLDEDAKEDVLVKDNLERFFDDHYFASQEDVVKKITSRLGSVCRESGCALDIINNDGVMAYGIQRLYILNCDCYAVGMTENGQFKTFPIVFGQENEIISDVIDWMFEDLIGAVGEEFCIEVVA